MPLLGPEQEPLFPYLVERVLFEDTQVHAGIPVEGGCLCDIDLRETIDYISRSDSSPNFLEEDRWISRVAFRPWG